MHVTICSCIGPWMGWVRRGFDNYLAKNYRQALGCYIYASEMGNKYKFMY